MSESSYDAEHDPVMLATWACVRESDARAWVDGGSVDENAAAALSRAQEEIRALRTSPEFEEVREEVRRFQKLPVARRWATLDAMTRSDRRVHEAWRRGME